jgi:hypothetical protein
MNLGNQPVEKICLGRFERRLFHVEFEHAKLLGIG